MGNHDSRTDEERTEDESIERRAHNARTSIQSYKDTIGKYPAGYLIVEELAFVLESLSGTESASELETIAARLGNIAHRMIKGPHAMTRTRPGV